MNISSLSLRVLECKTLVVKMEEDMTLLIGQKVFPKATNNFDSLIDMKILLSLACIQPLLTYMHVLMKISQAKDVYICNFIQVVKVC